MMWAWTRPCSASCGGVTWFHNDIKNLIETDPVTFEDDVNIGRATTQGFEDYLAWQPFETLKLRADYTYTEAEDADLHQELVRRPKNKITGEARWQAMDALSLDARLLYIGTWIDGSRDFSVSRLNAHPYMTVDLAASYALTENLARDGTGEQSVRQALSRIRWVSCSRARPSMPGSRRNL